MSWELRMGPNAYPVGAAGVTIGRSSDVDIPIHDSLVSRRHAIVRTTVSGLEIEDLGSTAGVRVNGVPIRAKVALKHGDRIAICAHEIGVVSTAGRAKDSGRGRERAVTIDGAPKAPQRAAPPTRPVPTGATGQASPLEVLLAGAEDALARGEPAECAFALPRVVDVLLRIERGPGADPVLLRRYAICSLRAARNHGRPEWIDAVIDVHGVRPRIMHAATVDALEGAIERLPRYDRARLRDYVEAISTLEGLRQYEQFCLDRLRTLVGA